MWNRLSLVEPIHRMIPAHVRCRNSHDAHDDVIKWKPFSRYWPFVWGIHRSPVNSPHKGPWRGALMFSFICTWINNWIINREAGDLRRHRAHYDVIVMLYPDQPWRPGHWLPHLLHVSFRLLPDLAPPPYNPMAESQRLWPTYHAVFIKAPGSRLSIKTILCDLQFKDKTAVRTSYLYNGNPNVTSGKMVNFVSDWTLSRSVWVCQKCCVASYHTSSNPQIQEFLVVGAGWLYPPCTPCLALRSGWKRPQLHLLCSHEFGNLRICVVPVPGHRARS